MRLLLKAGCTKVFISVSETQVTTAGSACSINEVKKVPGDVSVDAGILATCREEPHCHLRSTCTSPGLLFSGVVKLSRLLYSCVLVKM